jgi:hypothetical protein
MVNKRYLISAFAFLLIGCTTPNNVSVDANIGIDTGAAATAQPQATPTPWATSQPPINNPIRVQFGRGTWGTDIKGSGRTQYLLWARRGQVFATTSKQNAPLTIALHDPHGVLMVPSIEHGVGRYTLPANGDYLLDVNAHGSYTVTVEIR